MLHQTPAILDAGPGVLTHNPQLRGRFHFWRDNTGRRIVFSVYPISTVPGFSDVVAMAVRVTDTGRNVLWLGEICDTDDLIASSGLQRAIAQGASELHVHLIASNRSQRRILLDALTGRGRKPVVVPTSWRQRYAA